MRNSVASAGLKPYLLAKRCTASAIIVSANDVIEMVRALDMVAEKDMVDFCKLTKFFISILFFDKDPLSRGKPLQPHLFLFVHW